MKNVDLIAPIFKELAPTPNFTKQAEQCLQDEFSMVISDLEVELKDSERKNVLVSRLLKLFQRQ